MKEIREHFRTTKRQADELAKIAAVLEKNKSDIIREAVDEKLIDLKKNHPKLRNFSIQQPEQLEMAV